VSGVKYNFEFLILSFEPQKRAHSPLLAAGSFNEGKKQPSA